MGRGEGDVRELGWSTLVQLQARVQGGLARWPVAVAGWCSVALAMGGLGRAGGDKEDW